MGIESNKYYNLDQINFFHFVGQRYPIEQVTDGTTIRSFNSLFQCSKSYAILKTAVTSWFTEITPNGRHELHVLRARCALKLCFLFNLDTNPIMINVPINVMNESHPLYPEYDEVRSFEVHCIDTVSRKLVRVLDIDVLDVNFTASFVALHAELRSTNFTRRDFEHCYQSFANCTLDQAYTYSVLSTELKISKCEPVENEPQLTGVLSYFDKLDMSPEAVARAMAL